MSCHDEAKALPLDDSIGIKILLMGNPNVGKSVMFSKLTGKEVIASNYTGTTVGFTHGSVNVKGKEGTLIDVPGTYSLQATSPAEEVAIDFLNQGADVVLCVLDSTNLERNLNLALQIKEYNIPIIFALNLTDVAEQQGIKIDVQKLSKELNSPVIPTVATRNIGLRDIINKISELCEDKGNNNEEVKKMSQGDRWMKVGEIVEKVQTIEDKEPTFMEKMGEYTLRPMPGIPIAALVLLLSLAIVVGIGKGLRAGLLLPLINNFVTPFFTSIVSKFATEGSLIYNVLVGEYGVLIKGIEWPFALILPYVFLFYIVLAFLEDSGYLPRIAVLVDSIFRKIGIQGGNVVPLIMGYGCAVPAILGSRAATSYKERIIVASVVSLGIPCVAQTGAFIALLGSHSAALLVLVYIISFIVMICGGLILNKMIPGKSDPILLEIPNLLKPDLKSMVKKIWIRTKSFMIEAEVPMLIGVAFAALVAETGVLNSASKVLEPVIEGWLGLPKEATLGLILGIIRRELAVLPMLELNLNTLQLLVGSIVALFYIPCLSVVGVLIKEFGMKIALTISAITIILAFLFGGIVNQIGSFVLQII
ncbi:ferrous iron transport protein B [Gottschalkia acidurici 9a]|uniref:Ferrous iron transport protein B n=1 Tax=Gottschalkia acidurici (strain ATCC 7906 / DSM 604 / BCRC 14475 / CIP 104303 / KCTC 5404 / NCIMB 10678 / 9a) TaxID=1128398 RepID=K0AYH4_GOTA9|nr:ferrous iron transporter B [Gottschalkia acidurici]AFS77431.1 ferrous iron transport protein B [Gottschalkia acidurici 9a]